MGDAERNAEAFADGLFHTGVARRDETGSITYIGRTDDVFKASDYKISPFELESVLIEHPAVVEAAVVPAPDDLRLAVPKAYIVLAGGHEEGEEVVSTSCVSPASGSPRSSACVVWSSSTCPRRSRGRSAAWNCVSGKRPCSAARWTAWNGATTPCADDTVRNPSLTPVRM